MRRRYTNRVLRRPELPGEIRVVSCAAASFGLLMIVNILAALPATLAGSPEDPGSMALIAWGSLLLVFALDAIGLWSKKIWAWWLSVVTFGVWSLFWAACGVASVVVARRVSGHHTFLGNTFTAVLAAILFMLNGLILMLLITSRHRYRTVCRATKEPAVSSRSSAPHP